MVVLHCRSLVLRLYSTTYSGVLESRLSPLGGNEMNEETDEQNEIKQYFSILMIVIVHPLSHIPRTPVTFHVF